MRITTGHTFETALAQSLVEQGGYTEDNAHDYSPELSRHNRDMHSLPYLCYINYPGYGPEQTQGD